MTLAFDPLAFSSPAFDAGAGAPQVEPFVSSSAGDIGATIGSPPAIAAVLGWDSPSAALGSISATIRENPNNITVSIFPVARSARGGTLVAKGTRRVAWGNASSSVPEIKNIVKKREVGGCLSSSVLAPSSYKLLATSIHPLVTEPPPNLSAKYGQKGAVSSFVSGSVGDLLSLPNISGHVFTVLTRQKTVFVVN